MRWIFQFFCGMRRGGHVPEVKKVHIHGSTRWCRVCKKCSKVLEIMW